MNEKERSLDSLPFEIIELILRCNVITFRDICKLSSVCNIFLCIGKSNKLWQSKYQQMWPKLAALFDAHNTDWKNEFHIRFQFKKKISIILLNMAEIFYQQDSVSDDSFLDFREEFQSHPFGDYILVDELERIINDPNSHLNLTRKYYAKRALRYMHHVLLETVWRDYLSHNQHKLTLLKGACLISHWCQPTKIRCTENVYKQLNEILKLVFEQITKTSPEHPVIKQGLPIMNKENGQILDKSLWTPTECRIILCAINEVMFNTLLYCGTDYSDSASNSYIEKVLTHRSGIPITIGIIYETIAVQFGVACLPVNFPGHFLLKWLEYPLSTGPEAYTFIDVSDKGAFKSWRNLEDLAPGYENFSNTWIDAVSPVKVLTRMCWNLVEIGRQRDGERKGLLCLCNVLELLSLLSPNDQDHKLLLARVYIQLCINMTRVISLLQEISEQDRMYITGIVGYMYRAEMTNVVPRRFQLMKMTTPNQKLKVQPRKADCSVQFAVGMIMKHKKYNYRCIIYGWDSVCLAGEDWINEADVYNLPHRDKQPFYHILIEDGRNSYAAQENLEIDLQNAPVMHFGVGRFFESYHGNYYYPNSQKLEEYPNDIEARERALSAVS